MEVNVNNLQNLIRKATLNYIIPSVQLKIDGNTVVSKMRSSDNTVVVCLNTPNNIVSGLPDDIELNFDEPNTKVKPYLNLIDSENVELIITDDKMTLKDGRHRTSLHFCMSSFVTTFNGNEPRTTPFYDLDVNESIKDILGKVRKVAGKFEKIYFTIRGKRFIVETTDRTNRFANGISFELDNVNHPDVDICFDFKNFNAIMSCLGDEITDFTAKFTWMEAQRAGMVLFEKNDGSERYYLLSKLEE